MDSRWGTDASRVGKFRTQIDQRNRATSGGSVTSTGFLPLQEASGGGSNNSATNSPVIEVQRMDNGQIMFLPNDETRNISDTQFSSSKTALSGFPLGPMLVWAWVNGVPSSAVYTALTVNDEIFRDGFEIAPGQ